MRAADHSPPSSAAVIEEQSYTSTHPVGHTGPVIGITLTFLYISRRIQGGSQHAISPCSFYFFLPHIPLPGYSLIFSSPTIVWNSTWYSGFLIFVSQNMWWYQLVHCLRAVWTPDNRHNNSELVRSHTVQSDWSIYVHSFVVPTFQHRVTALLRSFFAETCSYIFK